MRRRLRKGGAFHAPKKFVSTFKLQDVIADRNGTNPGGWQRNNLAITFGSIPIVTQLSALYKQFTITGVKYEYRSTNPVPNETGAVDNFISQMLFCVDKDNEVAITESQARSQDDVLMKTTARSFNKYVAKPRPLLYQTDLGGNPIKVTVPAKQTQWFSTGAAPMLALKHLAAQMLIEDSPSAIAGSKQGELWVKVYVSMKEQCL